MTLGEEPPVTPSDMAAANAKGLAELSEGVEPFFEQARGIKARMEKEGWSPTAAEQIAETWLVGAIQFLWAAATSQAMRS